MKINELEELLQIPRANIRYYEKEGFLTPKRKENGYREYSDEDVTILKKIIILRKIGVSLQDIRAVLEGMHSLQHVLEKNEKNLREQLEELNGALDVCQQMEKDQVEAQNFDTDYYWDVIREEEKQGQKFLDLLRDYGEHERSIMFQLFGGPFIYEKDGKVYWFRLACVVAFIMVVCGANAIARGAMPASADFWIITCRPIIYFLLLSVLAFPIYLLGRKYKEEEEPEKVRGMNLLGMIAFMVVWCLSSIIGIPLLIENYVYDKIYQADQYYIINSPAFMIYFLLSLEIMLVLAWLFSKRGLFVDQIGSEERWRCKLPWKIRWKIGGAGLVLYACGLVFLAFCYNQFTQDGVVCHRFFQEKTYTWEDVDHITYKLNSYDVIDATLVMKDQHKLSWTDDRKGIIFEHYAEDSLVQSTTEYSEYVVKLLHEQGKDASPEVWDEIQATMEFGQKLAEARRKVEGNYVKQENPDVSVVISDELITASTPGTYEWKKDAIDPTIVITTTDGTMEFVVDHGDGGSLTLINGEDKTDLTHSDGEDGLNIGQDKYFEAEYRIMDGTGSGYQFHSDGTLQVITAEFYAIGSTSELYIDEEAGEFETCKYVLKDGVLTIYHEDGQVRDILVKVQ